MKSQISSKLSEIACIYMYIKIQVWPVLYIKWTRKGKKSNFRFSRMENSSQIQKKIGTAFCKHIKKVCKCACPKSSFYLESFLLFLKPLGGTKML